MIDTNKYEGHIENIGRWRMFADALPKWAEEADRELTADAPLLLAEVKRLHSLDGLLRSMEKDGITASGYDHLLAEVKRLRELVKGYDACLQNLWDKELIPEDTDIWDEVKELLEVTE